MPTVIIHLRHLWKVALHFWFYLVILHGNYHVIYEIGNQDHNLFDSLYVPAAIPCVVTCFKLLILPTQKNFIQRGSITRLHVAVEYLSNYPSINKTRKELTTPCSESMIGTSTIATSTSCRHSTVTDVTMRRFSQLMLGEHSASIYQIMDILERARELRPGDFKVFAKISVFKNSNV